MDLWQLQIFCKVVELKSFSKAGEAVHLSQPTVSSHIKELESHFGAQLIDRLARQALPTKAGELLYKNATRLLAVRDETESAMSEFLGSIKGRLTVGGSTIPGGYLLPKLIGDFCRTYPEVYVSLKVGDTSDILESISEGQIEAGIVGALSEDQQLEQKALAQDRLCIVVPADHPLARKKSIHLQALFDESFIIRESGSGTLRSLERQLKSLGRSIDELHIVAEMGSTEAIRQGIKNGVGISILSAIAVADDVNSGSLCTLTIEELSLDRLFYLTRHKHRTPSPPCRTFIQYVSAQFGHTAD